MGEPQIKQKHGSVWKTHTQKIKESDGDCRQEWLVSS